MIYCKVKRISFWLLADTLMPSLVLGQAIGRWGNFVNQEAYGNQITNPSLCFFPYGVYTEEIDQWRQVTFFYESALNLALLTAMLICCPHFRRKGYLLPFYMIGYGTIRFFVEGLRSDSLYLLPGIRVSQVMSGCLIILGIVILFITQKPDEICRCQRFSLRRPPLRYRNDSRYGNRYGYINITWIYGYSFGACSGS